MSRKKDYEVGYGKPPKHTQFRPGQSGNSRGRPRGARNLKTEFIEEMNEKLPLSENGQRRRNITKRRAYIKRLFSKALNGDVRAINALIQLELRLLGDQTDNATDAPLAKDEEALLELLQARAIERTTKRGKPRTRSGKGSSRRKKKNGTEAD